MLLITEYRFRPHMPKEDLKRLMDIFAQRGDESGTIGHYLKADGSGGIVIAEQDDVSETFKDSLAYQEFLEFKVIPALKIEDAVGPILAHISAS